MRIEGWARDGLTNEQIAHNMGISRSTLAVWEDKYPDISDALKKKKDVADRHIENSLYKRAEGYFYDEVTKERKLNRQTGQYELVVTKVVTKHVPADPASIFFWLKNRKPDEWRDKRIIADGNSAETILQNMNTLADIIQHPVENRSLSSFEEVQEDE